MNIGFIIAVSVFTGLLFIFIVLGLVYSRISKKLQKIVTDKFNKDEILLATTRANFFGIKSKGGVQVKGNGALVLTRNELYFIRAVPQKEYIIPISSIRNISRPLFLMVSRYLCHCCVLIMIPGTVKIQLHGR